MGKKSDEAKAAKGEEQGDTDEKSEATLLPPDVAGDIEAKAEAKEEAAVEAKKDEAPPQRKTDPGMTVVVPSEPPAMPEAKPTKDADKRASDAPTDGSIENPTYMPEPKDVPGGSPNDPSTVPGHVPPGDSRSLRRGLEFALVYRNGSAVISRFGVVGTRGQWRVVEYPTSASASNAYAKECSRFVADGFSDYRD